MTITKKALTNINKTIEVLETYNNSSCQFMRFLGQLDEYVDKFNEKDKFQIAGYNADSDIKFISDWFLDNNNLPVSNNESGKIVITRLYGKDTPIIRYDGLEDIAIPIDGKCSSGIKSKMIKNIEGRITDLIILPNNDTLSPLTLTGIPAKLMEEYNSLQIKQFQIVQNKKSEIEFLIVIDENLRNTGINTKKLFSEIKNRTKDQINHEIEVIVKEKKVLDPIDPSDKFKVFISNLNKTE